MKEIKYQQKSVRQLVDIARYFNDGKAHMLFEEEKEPVETKVPADLFEGQGV